MAGSKDWRLRESDLMILPCTQILFGCWDPNTQHRVRKECLRSRDDNGMAKDLVETGLRFSGYCEDGKKSLILTGLDFSFRDSVLLYSPG